MNFWTMQLPTIIRLPERWAAEKEACDNRKQTFHTQDDWVMTEKVNTNAQAVSKYKGK
jgi:hypothetical protein